MQLLKRNMFYSIAPKNAPPSLWHVHPHFVIAKTNQIWVKYFLYDEIFYAWLLFPIHNKYKEGKVF
jgi:hypothetical protein